MEALELELEISRDEDNIPSFNILTSQEMPCVNKEHVQRALYLC